MTCFLPTVWFIGSIRFPNPRHLYLYFVRFSRNITSVPGLASFVSTSFPSFVRAKYQPLNGPAVARNRNVKPVSSSAIPQPFLPFPMECFLYSFLSTNDQTLCGPFSLVKYTRGDLPTT